MPAAAPGRQRRALWRHPAVRIGGSVVLLAVLLTVVPFAEIRAALQRMPWYAWPLALVCYLLVHLIGVAKWRLLVNVAGAELGATGAVRAYYYGLFGNTFLPSLVGGDAVRLGVALQHARSRAALVLGSLIDRLQDVVGLLVLVGVGAWLSPFALEARSRQVFVSVMAALTVAGLGALMALRWFPVRRVPFRVRRRLVSIRSALRATTSRRGALVQALLLGMLLQSLLIVLNWGLGRAVGIAIPLYVWFFVWPLAKIASLAPVTQGGIGVREAAQAALFAPFGVSAAAAVVTGLVFQVVIITGGLVGGAIAALLGRQSPSAGGGGAERQESPAQRAHRQPVDAPQALEVAP